MDGRRSAGRIRAGSTRSPPAEPPAVPDRRRALGQRPRDAGAGHAGRRRRPSTRSCACSATPAPTRFIRAGAAAADRHPRAGHRDLPRQPPELRLPPAGPRRAGRAGDDRPDRRAASASRSYCDDVPIDTRIGIGLQGARPRRRQPRRGPARDALRRAGQPQLAHRLVLVRPQDATRRTAAPSGCSPTSSTRSTPRASSSCTTSPRSTLDTGACVSVEALLRWTHPQLGPVSPGEFVAARRDHGAGHADDPLGDRRGDAAGGDLAARGARPVGRGQRLAEEPRGAGLRRVPAVLLRGAPARPRRGSSSRSPKGSAPRAAG